MSSQGLRFLPTIEIAAHRIATNWLAGQRAWPNTFNTTTLELLPLRGSRVSQSPTGEGLHFWFTSAAKPLKVQTPSHIHTTNDWRLHMTDTYAANMEFETPQQLMPPVPDPLPPEDVLYLLTQQPPLGEHSVDAF